MGIKYVVPPDVRDEEKIVGGIFTKSQFMFLVIGFIGGMALTILLYSMTKNFIIAAFGLATGLIVTFPFAVIKIRSAGDMELFKYLVKKWKYKKRQKEYKNISDNYKGGIIA